MVVKAWITDAGLLLSSTVKWVMSVARDRNWPLRLKNVMSLTRGPKWPLGLKKTWPHWRGPWLTLKCLDLYQLRFFIVLLILKLSFVFALRLHLSWDYATADLIFVTNITNYIRGKKFQNFNFPCMTIVGKLKISPHVKKFQYSWWGLNAIYAVLLLNLLFKLFCCEILATNYALSCGEQLSPKVHLWRKNDKYQVCATVNKYANPHIECKCPLTMFTWA